MTPAATSADVCYRHPTRESWTLCTRCGRTICPECQILTPSGVQCPDCVQELGGSVRWQSAGSEPRKPKPSPKTRSRASREPAASGWRATVGRLLNPGGTPPRASWVILGVFLALWIVGYVVPGSFSPPSGLPFEWLAALPDRPIQLWRFLTAPLSYPSFLSGPVFFSILLSVVFFALTAPAVESLLGRVKFLWIFFAGGALGAAAMVLAGGIGFGLTGGLFALFGAYLIRVWSYPPARIQILVMIGVNLVISLALGGSSLPNLIGGLVAGAGAAFLFQRFEDRPRSAQRTPYLIVAAVVTGFVLIAIVRSLL